MPLAITPTSQLLQLWPSLSAIELRYYGNYYQVNKQIFAMLSIEPSARPAASAIQFADWGIEDGIMNVMSDEIYSYLDTLESG